MSVFNPEAEMLMEAIDAKLRLLPWALASILIVSGILLYLQAARVFA